MVAIGLIINHTTFGVGIIIEIEDFKYVDICFVNDPERIRRFKTESLADERFFNKRNSSINAEQAERIAEEQRKLQAKGQERARLEQHRKEQERLWLEAERREKELRLEVTAHRNCVAVSPMVAFEQTGSNRGKGLSQRCENRV